MTSTLARRILETFTSGAIRYRLDFVSEGHQRGLIRQIATRTYRLCPDILNDPRHAPWVISIRSAPMGHIVELTPRASLDPRFGYRRADVPAASHPPLAACLARFAGRAENEVVWDPFCGSGLELIERALLGGVRLIHATDQDPTAIAVAKRNFAAAKISGPELRFTCCDFHHLSAMPGLIPGSATLILTNPPMGKRVPVPDLGRLIKDLFSMAAIVLGPGGRLVFINPLRFGCPEPALKLLSRHVVDLGGFHCRLEKYVKTRSHHSDGGSTCIPAARAGSLDLGSKLRKCVAPSDSASAG